jgi:hypothetical protein
MSTQESGLEVTLDTGETFLLKQKSLYIVLEGERSIDKKTTDSGYSKVIVPWANQGKDYLVLTTVRPDIIADFGLKDIKQGNYLRLIEPAESVNSEEYTIISPTNAASAAPSTIVTWINNHKDKEFLVYIDKYAFQEIIDQQNVKSAVALLKVLSKRVEHTKGILVVSIDPATIEEKDYKPALRQLINIADSTAGCKMDEARIKY